MIENKKYRITGFDENFIKEWLQNLKYPESLLGDLFIEGLRKRYTDHFPMVGKYQLRGETTVFKLNRDKFLNTSWVTYEEI